MIPKKIVDGKFNIIRKFDKDIIKMLQIYLT